MTSECSEEGFSDLSDSDFEALEGESASDEQEDVILSEEEDEEENATSSTSDDDDNDDENWNSKDGTLHWSTKEPRRRRTRSSATTQAVGMQSNLSLNSPSEFFRQFITDEMSEKICEYTNKKAEEMKNKQKLSTWRNMDKTEFLTFIGLLLVYGVQKGRGKLLREFWSEEFGFPIFRATMSRSRFENILRCLRFDDGETREARRQASGNKAEAINELFSMFATQCRNTFIPGTKVTVDEHLCTFRGRCSFKVYIPSKPGKYGIKIWLAVDCENLYVINLQIYTGKQGDRREQQQGKRVVMDLVNHLSNSDRTITTDNFFTSYELAQELLSKGLKLVGTVRKSRKELPKNILPSKTREQYSTTFAYTNSTLLASYVPTKGKSVIMLSTHHEKFNISNTDKKKPEVILYYNSTKYGVDTIDQMARQYSVKRATRRWSLAIFFDIIDFAGINAYKLCARKNNKYIAKSGRRQFLLDLAKELVKPEITRRLQHSQSRTRKIRKAVESAGFRDLVPGPAPSSQPKNKRSRCSICPRGNDRKTNLICSICRNFVFKEHAEEQIFCIRCHEERGTNFDTDTD